MASSVQFLSNTTSASTTLLPSKPLSTPDDDGSGFQSELSKASDRQSQAAQDSGDSSNSADSTTDAKKTDKSKDAAPTKKTQAKGKSKKAQAGDQPAEDEADDTTVAAKKTGQSATPVDPTDAQAAEETDAVPVDPTKSTATKAKPTDPKAAVDPAAIPPQTKTAVAAAKTADTDEQNEDTAATTGAIPAAAKAAATAVQPTVPHAVDDTDATADATDPATTAAAKYGKAAAATSLFNNDDDTAEVQPKQVAAKKSSAATATDSTTDDAQAIAQYISDLISPADGAKAQPAKPGADSKDALAAVAAASTPKTTATATPTGVAKTAQPAPPPETQFAEANHQDIVKNIQTQLLPHGGTMQLRLDPPELGALQVTLSMKDGVMNATFQTSNDDATRLLSHSMTQLKTAMESAGISVDKLQVQHTPKDAQTNTSSDDQSKGQTGQDDLTRQQEQQRKETIKRMWRKLSGESDPLDMVA